MSSDLPSGAAGQRAPQRLAHLERVIRAEFAEMPGMRLSEKQIQKLWHLTAAEVEIVLAHLVDGGHLCRLPNGLIARVGDGVRGDQP